MNEECISPQKLIQILAVLCSVEDICVSSKVEIA